MKPIFLKKLGFEQIRDVLLKEARTDPGRDKLRSIVPHQDLNLVKKNLEKTKEVQKIIEIYGLLPLPSLKPLSLSLQKASRGQILDIPELHEIRKYLLTVQEIKKYFKESRLFKGLFSRDLPKELLFHINKSIDPEGQEVIDTASKELDILRKKSRELGELIFQKLRDLLIRGKRERWLQEDLITQRRGRYVLPVKVEAKHKLAGILHDVSASGATVYIEPANIIPLANELEELKARERREIFRILKELSQKVLSYKEDLLYWEEVIAEIDILQSKVLAGQKWRGSIPKVGEGDLKLLKAVHPSFFLENKPAISNDFIFPKDKPVVLISGPNLGGKTVALKTVGLLCCMVQMGLPIPASADSFLPVFEDILVDIGDDQDLSQDESTFSAHLKRLKLFLEEASPRKLILIDELGRGTDPSEGSALAMAFLENMIENKARVLATTHYTTLKAFSLQKSGILPLSMAFDKKTGKPTYRLVYGASGFSHAFSLARDLGFPKSLLEKARGFLSEKEGTFRNLLESLQDYLREIEQEKKALKRQRCELEREKLKLEQERELWKRAWKDKERDLLLQAQERLKEWEKEFQELLASLAVERIGRQKAQDKVFSFLKKKYKELYPSYPVPENIPLGARVKLKGLDQEGRVLKVKGEWVEIQIGPFKTEVSKDDILLLPDEGPVKGKISFSVTGEKKVPSSINLIGLSVEEALEVLDKMIDRAFLIGRSRLTVIHGLGTGRLLRAIRKYLNGHEQVACYRPGERHEGGDAVTIVELATRGN